MQLQEKRGYCCWISNLEYTILYPFLLSFTITCILQMLLLKFPKSYQIRTKPSHLAFTLISHSLFLLISNCEICLNFCFASVMDKDVIGRKKIEKKSAQLW